MTSTFAQLSASLSGALAQEGQPIGPQSATTLTVGKDGNLDVSRLPLHETLSSNLPILALPLLKIARAMPDGRGSMLLLFHHLLRLITDDRYPLNPDRERRGRYALRQAFHEKSVIVTHIDDLLHSMRVEPNNVLIQRCALDYFSARVSKSLSDTFTRLVMKAPIPTGDQYSDLITFSECKTNVESDSAVEASVGIMFDKCWRSICVERSGKACILKLHGMWFGAPVEDDSDSDEADIDEVPATSESYLRFQKCLSSLASTGVSLVLTSAHLPQWMTSKPGEAAPVELVHSLDKSDLSVLLRRLGVSYAKGTEGGISVGNDATFGFSSCRSCGHKATSDKQFLEIKGITTSSGEPCNFIHLRVPSVRLVLVYKELLVSGLKLLNSVRSEGLLLGGGHCYNYLGYQMCQFASRSTQYRHELDALSTALRLLAGELSPSRQVRFNLMQNPSSGISIQGYNAQVLSADDLVQVGLVIPYTVGRNVVINAIALLSTVLSIDAVVGVAYFYSP